MGVPTFFRWLSIRYPKTVVDAVEPPIAEAPDGSYVVQNPELPNPNGEFDCLYLDMNGIIHPCCRPEGGSEPETFEEMFENIFMYIDKIVSIIRPQKLIYMAVDGVAPRAKMNQQRVRRFKAVKESAEIEEQIRKLEEEFVTDGRAIPAKKEKFDGNQITPGTPFMHQLSEALRFYIATRFKLAWKNTPNLKVILSDANNPGEGEHKIMDFIRSQRSSPDYNANMRHCLYGADADLIMLGLATHEAHFYIIREIVINAEDEAKRKLADQERRIKQGLPPATAEDGGGLQIKPMSLLRIPVLREYLRVEFDTQKFVKPLPFEYDFERVIDDFVFMCFFVGNDFLPHLPSLSIHKGSIDQMVALYQHVLPDLGSYLSDKGQVNFKATAKFVSFLGQVEDDVFRNELSRNRRLEASQKQQKEAHARLMERKKQGPTPWHEQAAAPSQLSRDVSGMSVISSSNGGMSEGGASRSVSVGLDPDPNSQSADAIARELGLLGPPETPAAAEGGTGEDRSGAGFKRKADGTVAVSSSSSSSASASASAGLAPHEKRQQDIDAFKQRLKAIRDEGDGKNIDTSDQICLGEGIKAEWRNRYYTKKFGLVEGDDENVQSRRVAYKYVEGMAWVLRYYYTGVPNWGWFYPFHYAPFASDMAVLDEFEKDILEALSEKNLGEPLLPFQQLMAVLPPKSGKKALPEVFHPLMTDEDSPLADFYPRTFAEDPDGKPKRWLWVALLPFIDCDRLKEVVVPIEKGLSGEAAGRNVMGKEILYVGTGHPLAEEMQTLHSRVQQESSKEVSEVFDDIKASLSQSLTGVLRGCGEMTAPGDAFTMVDMEANGESWSAEFVELPREKVELHCRLLTERGAAAPTPVLDRTDTEEGADRDRKGGFNGPNARRQILTVLGVNTHQHNRNGYTNSFMGGDRRYGGPPGFGGMPGPGGYGRDPGFLPSRSVSGPPLMQHPPPHMQGPPPVHARDYERRSGGYGGPPHSGYGPRQGEPPYGAIRRDDPGAYHGRDARAGPYGAPPRPWNDRGDRWGDRGDRDRPWGDRGERDRPWGGDRGDRDPPWGDRGPYGRPQVENAPPPWQQRQPGPGGGHGPGQGPLPGYAEAPPAQSPQQQQPSSSAGGAAAAGGGSLISGMRVRGLTFVRRQLNPPARPPDQNGGSAPPWRH